MKFENKKVIYVTQIPSWCRDFAVELKAREICQHNGFYVNHPLMGERADYLWFCPQVIDGYSWHFSAADNDARVTSLPLINVTIDAFFELLESYGEGSID